MLYLFIRYNPNYPHAHFRFWFRETKSSTEIMERIAIILLAVFVAAYAKEISNFNKREDGETSLLHERGFSEAVEAGEMKNIQRRYDSSTGILDTADKKEILDKHNEHRAAASPTASNMKKMVSTNTTNTVWPSVVSTHTTNTARQPAQLHRTG